MILAGRRGAKTGSFVIALEDGLLDQIDVARRMQRGEVEPDAEADDANRSRSHSALSPREMQARLRAGRTVADVAAEAGVDLEWVERFAAPVLAEQAAAVARAGELTLKTPRRGLSDRSLSDSVLRNLTDRGVRMSEDELASAWSANHLVDGEWSIRFDFSSRGRPHQAEWTMDMATGTLLAKNRLGTELGFVDPGRHAPFVRQLPPPRVPRPAPVSPEPELTEVETAEPSRGRRGARRPGTKKVAARRVTPASAGRPRRTGSRAARKATPARPAPAAKKAVAKKAPAAKKAGGVKKTAAKRSPAKRAATKRTATKTPAGRKKAVAKKIPAPRRPGRPPKKAAARQAAPAPRKPVGKKASTARKATPVRKATAAKKARAPRSPRPVGRPRKEAHTVKASAPPSRVRVAAPTPAPASAGPPVASHAARSRSDHAPVRADRPLRARPRIDGDQLGSLLSGRPLRARPLRARSIANVDVDAPRPTIRAVRAVDQFSSTAETPRIGAHVQT